MPLKVGVIGTGGIARNQHLPAWSILAQEGRVVIEAVCDAVEERAQSVREQFGAGAAYTDYEQMLREREFDIIDICAHNRMHHPVAMAALNAGAHVLVEKPMAMGPDQAHEMADAARANGLKLMVAQHYRFMPENEKLKEVITRGDLGRLYYGSAVYLRRRGIPGWGKFHIKRESLGGPLIDIGVHVVDLALWLLDFPKPISVSGKVYSMFGHRKDLVNRGWAILYPPEEFDVEDYATALVRCENDVTLQIEVSWAANIPEDRSNVTVLGDTAGVCTDPLGVFGADGTALTTQRFDWLPTVKPHHEEIFHFAACVEQNLPVRVQPEQSVMVQHVIDAIYRSSEQNAEVAVEGLDALSNKGERLAQ
jgi:predicted dehydrogenase